MSLYEPPKPKPLGTLKSELAFQEKELARYEKNLERMKDVLGVSESHKAMHLELIESKKRMVSKLREDVRYMEVKP